MFWADVGGYRSRESDEYMKGLIDSWVDAHTRHFEAFLDVEKRDSRRRSANKPN